METQNIEKMVHRIRGIFPSNQIFFTAVVDAWQQDDFLLSITPDEARRAIPLIEEHGTFPSLPEMRDLIRKANNKEKPVIECDKCGQTGWDTGLDMMYLGNDQWKVVRWRFGQTYEGRKYSAAKRCDCGN
jgi:hypothetical protein